MSSASRTCTTTWKSRIRHLRVGFLGTIRAPDPGATAQWVTRHSAVRSELTYYAADLAYPAEVCSYAARNQLGRRGRWRAHGNGHAEVSAVAGMPVVVRDLPQFLEAARARVEKSLAGAVKHGKMDQAKNS